MGLIHVEDHSGGWNPSMDLVNGPSNAQPRLDNLVMDELGNLSLRRGQNVISGLNPLTAGPVTTLFTNSVDGIRCRYAAAEPPSGFAGIWASYDANVYNQILSNFDGEGDVRFGSMLGQTLIARGTTKFKHDVLDGDSRHWGIPAPINQPSLSTIPSDGKSFSTFNTGESPAWVATEGTMTEAVGYDESPAGARQVTMSSSAKGTIRKTFSSVQNFEAYDGGDTGTDYDLIEFYLWIQEPDRLEYISLQIDCNEDDSRDSARFRDDYFHVEITPGDAITMKLDPQQERDEFDVVLTKIEREDILNRDAGEQPTGSIIPRPTPVTNSGWAHFSIPRGKFFRVGSTPGKGWNSVIAVQFTFKYSEDLVKVGTTSNGPWSVRFDELRIIGGANHPYTGKYRVAVQYVSVLDKYTGKSGISEISEEIECKANALRVSHTIDSSEYGWITHIYVYIAGGTIPGFYRAEISSASAPENGSQDFTIELNLSDRDILVQNNQLDHNITVPPDGIVDISGPFDSRLFCLTPEGIHVSLPNDPDAYSSDHVLVLPGKAAYPYFVRNVAGEPILATSRGWYRILGDGSISPDGVINYQYRDLNIPPPISEFCAQEGNLLVYLAGDGLRVFNGSSSIPLRGALELLFQGETRYGVAPSNMGSQPGRFRGGIFNNQLHAMFPESSPSNNIGAVYNLNIATGKWYRAVQPTKLWTVYREPDGQILAGDEDGFIYQLEANSGVGDQIISGGAYTYQPIPITWYTKSLDGGQPLNFKEPEDFRMYELEADVPVSVALHAEGSETPFETVSLETGELLRDVSSEDSDRSFRRIQFRVTGSFTSFKARSLSLTFRKRPIPRLHWDSGFIRIGRQRLVHLRRLIIMMRVQAWVDVKVFFDEELVGEETIDAAITVGVPVLTMHEVKFGRECWGKQIRITLTSQSNLDAGAFEPYWAEVYFRDSGDQKLDKKFITIDGDKI